MAEHRWDTAPSAAAETPGIPLPVRRRWLLSLRAAVLAVCLLLGTAAAFAVLRGGTPVEVSSVELDPSASGSTPAGTEDGRSSDAENADADTAADAAGGAASHQPRHPSGGRSSAGGSAEAAPAALVVHVAGAVLHPGVVSVPDGSRTVDAVQAAGGAAPDADLTAVNLAAALQDGSMVVVPRIGDPPRSLPGAGPLAGSGTGGSGGSGGGDGGGAGSGPAALVNLNTASLQELDTLPRVGPVIAERIVAWREAHGAFSRPEDLDAVPGIGEAMLASLLPLVTV